MPISCAAMRKKVNFFVSYSHRNQLLAEDIISRLNIVLRPSKNYDYRLWMDSGIIIGEGWKKQIFEARDGCDFGLLLISPAFLGSGFICEEEIPHFVGDDRAASIPVLLQPVDFQLHDLKGLETLQIFRFKGKRFTEPRSYAECRKSKRDDFVFELFRAIEKKLAAFQSKC